MKLKTPKPDTVSTSRCPYEFPDKIEGCGLHDQSIPKGKCDNICNAGIEEGLNAEWLKANGTIMCKALIFGNAYKGPLLSNVKLWVFSICSDGALVMKDRAGFSQFTTEQDVLTALRTGTARFAKFQNRSWGTG